jgi:hypothetical protein
MEFVCLFVCLIPAAEWLLGTGVWVRVPVKARDYSVLRSILTASVSHPTPSLINAVGVFTGIERSGGRVTTRFCPVSRFGRCGTVSPLRHTPSVAPVTDRGNFAFIAFGTHASALVSKVILKKNSVA